MSDLGPNTDGNPSFATEINNLKAEAQRLENDRVELGAINDIIAAMEAKEAARGVDTTPGAPGPITEPAVPAAAPEAAAPAPAPAGDQFTSTQTLGPDAAATPPPAS
jgi:hypothetical protein